MDHWMGSDHIVITKLRLGVLTANFEPEKLHLFLYVKNKKWKKVLKNRPRSVMFSFLTNGSRTEGSFALFEMPDLTVATPCT